MKRIGLIFCFMLLSWSISAQDYRTGLGVRGGLFSGFSVKHFVSRTEAIEGILALHHRGLFMSGIYQVHAMAFDAPGLNWYYGGGAHLGFYNRRHTPWFPAADRGPYTNFGLLGIVGLEYSISEIPISVGVDISPAINIIEHVGFWIGAGITLRYTIY